MGRVRNSKETQSAHRAGPLKQANKKHKTGRHRSKGVIDVETRGRVSGGGSAGKVVKNKMKRSERRKQAAANRDKKIQEVLDKKRTLGGARGAPICIALIPLSNATNVKLTLKAVVENSNSFATVVGQAENTTHLKLSTGKNLMLIVPANNDIWTILDTLKLCDISMFVLPQLESISPEGLTLLKAAKDQGLATPFLSVISNFNKTEEKAFLKSVAKYLPVEKIYPLTNPGNISNALRMATVAKMTIPTQWSKRSSILIEDYQLVHDVDPKLIPFTPTEQGSQLLQICGVVRRKNLDPHRPVYISGCGSFQILRIDVSPLESVIDNRKLKMDTEMDSSVCSPPPVIPPRFVLNPVLVPKEIIEESAENLNNDDEMHSGSDIDEADYEDYDESGSENSADMEEDDDNSSAKKLNKKRLPKGTSDYQADWLINSDEEGGDGVINSDDELESESGDSGDEEDEEEDDEDMELDWEEEQQQLKVAKEARTEAEFPDWIDTPIDTPAKDRFQRYRGLQSFKNSSWDVNENLPKDYSKVFQFQNYRHTYKLVARDKSTDDGIGFIPVGQRITILLKPLDENSNILLSKAVGSSKLVSMVSLLRHETRMSVLNLHLHVTEIVKNKEELIFQVGFYRFTAKPILSEISSGNKHKMLRYAQENSSCMMTIFGPIVFPVISVLAFKLSKATATLIPVGHGSLFSIDPARIVTKRVLLSGYPYKVQGRSAVIRFMFFNRDDINWFKPVELKTRYGRRGHIKEPLGTHGHMKCLFDGQMKSQDTVLMPLYKRVFPKWNYDQNVPPFFVYDQQYLNYK